jgi:hypothetical protein
VQGWHERSERLRDLRTQAATGLVTAVLEGMPPLNAILRADPVNWDSLQKASDELDAAYDASIDSTARVDLLFGIKSPTGEASTALTTAFAQIRKEIETRPADLAKTRELRDDFADRLDEFTQAAHAVVMRSWRS